MGGHDEPRNLDEFALTQWAAEFREMAGGFW